MKLKIFIFFVFLLFSSSTMAENNKINSTIILNIKGFCPYDSKCFVSYDKIKKSLQSNIKSNISKDLKIMSAESINGDIIKYVMNNKGLQYTIHSSKDMRFKPSQFNPGVDYLGTNLYYIDNRTVKCDNGYKREIGIYYLKKCSLIKPYVFKGFLSNQKFMLNLHIFWYGLTQ